MKSVKTTLAKNSDQKSEFFELRKDFPILDRKVHGRDLVYFDNAATSQKPKSVIDTIDFYYKNYNANVHRSIHSLGEQATEEYEKSREKVADFIKSPLPQNIIFTKNSTESLNLLAYSLTSKLKQGDEIVISQMEHHSNFVPWQQLAKQRGLKLNFIEINKNIELDEESIKKNITKKTKIVSVMHVSNAIGTINPVEKITKIAHENNALMIVDGSQAAPHISLNMEKINSDFYVFTGHKMLGPTGVGVLYGKKEQLENMHPFLYGGEMINEVKFEGTTFNKLPWKFEAGTPNISEAIGLGAAVDYLQNTGMEKIEEHDREITEYAVKRLGEIKGITIYGPKKRGPIVSFNIKGVHAHDVAQILDSVGVAIRAGHHCCMPLMSVIKVGSTARASFYLYNTKEEVDKFIEGINKVKKVFGV
ncbi:MAG TPA: cysteine desulfurase [Candidatus Nanoarchaeia archaeon]|nr:cysteine desulfurase [Candidatus Nanoarchaeia archaeon]